jgi:hypothetical protein
VFRCGFAIVFAAVLVAGGCANGNDCTNCNANSRVSVGPDPVSPDVSPAPTVSPKPLPEPAPEPATPTTSQPNTEPYGNCLEPEDSCAYGDSPHCLVDDQSRPTMAFCTSDCGSAQECPRAPFGGTAAPSCLTLGGSRGECVLDCLDGQSCPGDMVCLPFGVCGYVTPDAEDPYDQCDHCPDDSLGCLEAGLGTVCLPACSDECPAARTGDALRTCVESGGQIGCALACDVFRDCPEGMACVPFGFQSLCVWPYDDPCAQRDCGPNAFCEIRGGQPTCVCPGDLLLDDNGNCVDACAVVTCHPTAHCEEPFGICACDPGEVMDSTGRCDVPSTGSYPCYPNPCQAPTSTCVVRDGQASCECPNPGEQPPDCSSGCNETHLGGDDYEPNDCGEDATLIGAGNADLGLSRLDANFGPGLDDVDRFRLPLQNGWYWVLLEAPAPICDLAFVPLPDNEAFGGFGFGVQLRADQSFSDWACRYDSALADQTTYSLGAVYFAAGDDLPDLPPIDPTQPPPVTPLPADQRSIADRFEKSSDIDVFGFTATLPVSLSFTGQRAALDIAVYDSDGVLSDDLSVECGFSLEPATCVDIPGSGAVTVVVRAKQSDQAEQRELDAWQLSW